MMYSQSFTLHHLIKWDVNNDRENVNRLSVWAQSEYKSIQQENWAYTGNDHYDEDVSRN
jgi:hypothetical protein